MHNICAALYIVYDPTLTCTHVEQFPEFDELYCNYSFVYGQDWAVVSVSLFAIEFVYMKG